MNLEKKIEKYEKRIKELEDREKELEQYNQILQEYFSMTSTLDIFSFNHLPLLEDSKYSKLLAFTVNLSENKIVWINGNFAKFVGYNLNKFISKSMDRFLNTSVHYSDRKKLRKVLTGYEQGMQKEEQVFLRLKNTVNDYEWLLASFELISLDKNKSAHVQIYGIILDNKPEQRDDIKMYLKQAYMKNQMSKIELLTKRQKQILVMMGKGLTSKQIAESLNISFHTVEAHRKIIAKKTQTRKRAGLISLAAEVGIIN